MSSVFVRFFLVMLMVALAFSCNNPVNDDSPPEPAPQPTGRFIAVGVGGAILYSDDGFATCSHPDSHTTNNLRGVAADAQGHCVAVGALGTFLYSDDRGASWHTATTTPVTGNRINRVVCYGLNKFMAAGEGSGDAECIFRSTNGGHSWTAYGLSRVFKGIGNRSEGDFVAVGYWANGGSTLHYLSYTYTADQSNPSWAEADSANIESPTMLLYDVVGTDHSYFVAVGTAGCMYSTDGGTWHNGGSVTGVLYAATWHAPTGRLFAVGDSSAGGVTKGRIHYSSYTGAAWTEIPQPDGTGLLFDVDSDGGGQFAAVGSDGEVRYSLSAADDPDAGLTWEDGTSGVTVDLYGVAYVAP